MLKVEVEFWTDQIASEKGKLVPKVAWDSGTLHILKNEGHANERSKAIPFESLSELQPTIEKAFKGEEESRLSSFEEMLVSVLSLASIFYCRRMILKSLRRKIGPFLGSAG